MATPTLTRTTQARDLRIIRELVHELCGISLKAEKDQLVLSRVNRRLKALGLSSLNEYVQLLQDDDSNEVNDLLDVITTNKTSFFRESKHFDFLRDQVIPERLAQKNRKLRIWSAACSTGEEPLTIAMVLREALPNWLGWDVRILATDLSHRVLAHAQEATYNEATMASVPPGLRHKYFSLQESTARSGQTQQNHLASSELRTLISWARLNLLGPWPMSGPFDLIFCRNVMIYFERSTQENLIARFRSILVPGGYLFVGHSEGLSGLATGLEYVQASVYRKQEEELAP